MKTQFVGALVALFCAAALSACGQPAPTTAGETAAPPQETDSVILGSTQNMPDWLFVARQRDCAVDADGVNACELGDVHFNQRTITRNAEDGTADIWVQVRHGVPQIFEIESETTRTTVRYELQRVHYRFNCANEQFFVVERLIMGPNETIAARDAPRQIYRDPVTGSITRIVLPIACRGA